MSLVKLPVRIQQEVKCYTQFALPLCVIFTEKNYHPWILKNFMEIKSAKKISKNGNHLQYAIDNAEDNNLLQVDYADTLDIVSVSWAEMGNQVEFVKSRLDDGFYVHHQLDEFYLREKPAYNKQHYLHPSLIYGYSDEVHEFYAIGFIGAAFKAYIIKFEELAMSAAEYDFSEQSVDSNSHKRRNSYCYKLKPVSQIYRFDMLSFQENLKKYLLSPEIDGWVYGLGGYGLVLNNLLEPYKPNCYLKYNTTHLLCEHKKIFLLAFEYICSTSFVLNKFSGLICEYKEVVRKFESIRLMHMEEIISKNSGYFIFQEDSAKIMYEKINEVYREEKDLVRRILDTTQALV
jgi:hypothetical protein